MARRGTNLFKRNDGLRALKIARDGGIEPAMIEIVAKDGTIFRVYGDNATLAETTQEIIRDGVLTIRQQKTGATLAIPVHPDLAAIIAATPIGHLTLLTTKKGKSYDTNVFSDEFRSWCNAAGLPQRCVFHGLRKAALTRLADCGCTAHEIAAISGHKSLVEVERYTKAADQVRLARAAMERIANESVKPEPSGVSKSLDQLAKKAG